MTTIDLTNYSSFFQDFMFISISTKFTNNEYIIKYNDKNELTVYFRDEHKDLFFQFPHLDDVKNIYCKLDTKAELQKYIDILNHNTEETIKALNI
jgi:hypothetical protein